MQIIAKFEKVSEAQYLKDWKQYRRNDEQAAQNTYKNILLPQRATKGSAGYDFYAPCDISIWPKASVCIPTGIRVRIDEGWMMAVFPRSGLGFRYRICLANTVGIIDSDYYEANNEGHIMLKLVNGSEKHVDLRAGSAIAQGIFLPIGFAVEDEVEETRQGGLGSTSERCTYRKIHQ